MPRLGNSAAIMAFPETYSARPVLLFAFPHAVASAGSPPGPIRPQQERFSATGRPGMARSPESEAGHLVFCGFRLELTTSFSPFSFRSDRLTVSMEQRKGLVTPAHPGFWRPGMSTFDRPAG